MQLTAANPQQRHHRTSRPGWAAAWTTCAPSAREMVSAAVRTAGPTRSTFSLVDHPETDSAAGTVPPTLDGAFVSKSRWLTCESAC